MNELKARVMDIVNKVNQNWVIENDKLIKKLKNAIEKNDDINLSELMSIIAEGANTAAGQYSKNLTELDEKFRESLDRMKTKKKGGWF